MRIQHRAAAQTCLAAVLAFPALCLTSSLAGAQNVELKLTVVGPGEVRDPNGNICKASCTVMVPRTTRASLRARAPNSVVYLSAWSGDCRGRDDNCTLDMTEPRSVTATFASLPHYTVTVIPPAHGTVVMIGTAMMIQCPVPGGPKDNPSLGCVVPLVQNARFSLGVQFAPGYKHVTWGGDCASSGTGPNCPIVLTKNMTITATFSP